MIVRVGEDSPNQAAAIFRQAEFRIHQRKPSVEPQWVKRFKQRSIDLAKQTARSPVPLCLVVDFSSTAGAGPTLFESPASFISEQSSLPSHQKLVVTVDRHGRVLGQETVQWDDTPHWDPVWAAFISENRQAVVFHIHGVTMGVYESGVPMEEISDVWRPKYPFVAKSDRHHPAHEYALLVKRHFDDCVQFHRVVVYWKDRAKRVFVGGPEKLFQRHLWWYLDEFILDHRDVSMEDPLGGLTDRTDIRIETVNDERYILEIKWLGKSENSKYDEDRAKEGARQTIVYLDRSPHIKRAALVIYDGRGKDEEIPWTSDEMHPKLDLSLRLYIESKTASQVAKGE